MKRNVLLVMAAFGIGLTVTQSANAQDAVMVEEESITVADAVDCKTNYYVNRGDNWFIQLGAGIDVPMLENKLDNGKAKRHITAAYNLGAGRWFSPYLGFRFSAYYGAMHWDNDVYCKAQYANLNFDFMWGPRNPVSGSWRLRARRATWGSARPAHSGPR